MSGNPEFQTLHALIHSRMAELGLSTITEAERRVFGTSSNQLRHVFDGSRCTSRVFLKLLHSFGIIKDQVASRAWLAGYLLEEFGQEGGKELLAACGLAPADTMPVDPVELAAPLLGERELAMQTVYRRILVYLAGNAEPALRRDIQAAAFLTANEAEWPLKRMVDLGWATKTVRKGTIVDTSKPTPVLGALRSTVDGHKVKHDYTPSSQTHQGRCGFWQITDLGRKALVEIEARMAGKCALSAG